jgi:ADP-ribose pyrophosphatase YjhB (NUDIX family)
LAFFHQKGTNHSLPFLFEALPLVGRNKSSRYNCVVNTASHIWKPNVTVAAVVERGSRFLLVEEQTEHGLRFNQPAGHLERDESLVAAVIRETLEETAHDFTPHALLGVYQYRNLQDVAYLRFAFIGAVTGHDTNRKLDTGIARATWLTSDEVRAFSTRHRSPLVMRCIDDYLAGQCFPLELITDYA